MCVNEEKNRKPQHKFETDTVLDVFFNQINFVCFFFASKLISFQFGCKFIHFGQRTIFTFAISENSSGSTMVADHAN